MTWSKHAAAAVVGSPDAVLSDDESKREKLRRRRNIVLGLTALGGLAAATGYIGHKLWSADKVPEADTASGETGAVSKFLNKPGIHDFVRDTVNDYVSPAWDAVTNPVVSGAAAAALPLRSVRGAGHLLARNFPVLGKKLIDMGVFGKDVGTRGVIDRLDEVSQEHAGNRTRTPGTWKGFLGAGDTGLRDKASALASSVHGSDAAGKGADALSTFFGKMRESNGTDLEAKALIDAVKSKNPLKRMFGPSQENPKFLLKALETIQKRPDVHGAIGNRLFAGGAENLDSKALAERAGNTHGRLKSYLSQRAQHSTPANIIGRGALGAALGLGAQVATPAIGAFTGATDYLAPAERTAVEGAK